MDNLKLTPLQFMWLNSQGGRTVRDIIVRDNGLFVKMRKERQDVLVRVPSDYFINLNYEVCEGLSTPGMILLRGKLNGIKCI
jgi:hypothetical protein